MLVCVLNWPQLTYFHDQIGKKALCSPENIAVFHSTLASFLYIFLHFFILPTHLFLMHLVLSVSLENEKYQVLECAGNHFPGSTVMKAEWQGKAMGRHSCHPTYT